MMNRVLITGITGQDGSYLAESCLSSGYEVHGVVRRSSNLARPRIDHLFNPDEKGSKQSLKLHYADLNDTSALIRVIDQIKPDYIYNLAAQSHVAVSFEVPIETGHVTGLGALSIFEAVRIVNPEIRIYQAGSSEMFGGMLGRELLNEESLLLPKSPYAAAKVFAHNQAIIYRDSYGMFISNGILFNHESPRRGENFVSRKITLAAARISLGLQSKLNLGNLKATRDWGHAKDYVEAMRLILESDSPDDYIVATGEHHSVLDFAVAAFNLVGLNALDYIQIDKNLLRPNEVEDLLGDPKKIKSKLKWERKMRFHELVTDMTNSDLLNIKNGNL